MATARVASSRARLTGRAAVLVLVLAVLAMSYASSMRAYLRQRSEINTLKMQIAEQRADVATLEQTRERLHDPAYIRTLARLRFGWLMPGETGYRVIDADGHVLPDGGAQLTDPAARRRAADPEWWQDVWGSVVAAGRQPGDRAAGRAPQRTPVDRIRPRSPRTVAPTGR